MIDPLAQPPVLTTRTIICVTPDCSNQGIEITLECAGTVMCGVCGLAIPDDDARVD